LTVPDLPNRLIEVHHKMFSFIARRLGLLIPTFFGITLLTFALIRMIPGDPVEVMMGERRSTRDARTGNGTPWP